MNILAENQTTYLTEDEENWILNFKDGSEQKLTPKKENPAYPVALVLKWRYTPVDIERLNEISRSLKKRED
jgi:hypothetical protein